MNIKYPNWKGRNKIISACRCKELKDFPKPSYPWLHLKIKWAKRVTGENHKNLVVLCGMRTFIKKQRPKETVKPRYFYAKFGKV